MTRFALGERMKENRKRSDAKWRATVIKCHAILKKLISIKNCKRISKVKYLLIIISYYLLINLLLSIIYITGPCFR